MVWRGRLGFGGVRCVQLGITTMSMPRLLTIMARLAYPNKGRCIMAGIFGHCGKCGALTKIKNPYSKERILCWSCRRANNGLSIRFEFRRRQLALMESIINGTKKEQNDVK